MLGCGCNCVANYPACETPATRRDLWGIPGFGHAGTVMVRVLKVAPGSPEMPAERDRFAVGIETARDARRVCSRGVEGRLASFGDELALDGEHSEICP